MGKLYLVTGATGHVGSVLTEALLARGEHVRALVLPGSAGGLPAGVDAIEGDVSDEASLEPFFDLPAGSEATLIHCAALITLASKENPRVWDVNVAGTDNVMRQAARAGVVRVVYVSSVHAIPERPAPQLISEVDSFDAVSVHGQYAKSKAAAAAKVLEHARQGLNVSIVHPSGVIGPGDALRTNHMVRTLNAMARGAIPAAIQGGYDFVDSRDVAAGILACEEAGRPGRCYILSGHYISVLDALNMARSLVGKGSRHLELPHALAALIAPAAERIMMLAGDAAPIFTPYSVYTLHTNGRFSHERATRELGYQPRPIEESIRASIWKA